MDFDDHRKDIAYRHRQIDRQQQEILQLQQLGISTEDASALLERMQNRVDALCLERDRMRGERLLERKTYADTNKIIRGAQGRRV